MVESRLCPNCTLPVKPRQAFCANCGASLAVASHQLLVDAPETTPAPGPEAARETRPAPTAGQEPEPAPKPDPEPAREPMPEPEPEPAAGQEPEPAPKPNPEPAREPVPEPEPGPAREALPEPEPGPEPARDAAPEPVPELELEQAPAIDPELLSYPGAGGAGRIPGSYLAPADGVPPSTWTIQPSTSSILGAHRPGSNLSLPVVAIPVATPALSPAPVPSDVASAVGEPIQELVAFGLSVAGAALGIASFFLPWTGANGIGVGTTQLGAANQWAFAMPAGIPLLVVTALILGGVAGSDWAQVKLPKLASVIERVTDTILPMILGGLYLGVALLYVTLPSSFGYGTGIVVLLLAAVLLVAGSVVCMFFPSDTAAKVE